MLDRRTLLNRLAMTGIGVPIFHRAIAALSAGKSRLDVETLRQAQWISGCAMTDEELESIVETVNRTSESLQSLRKFELDADVPMALHFSPLSQPAKIAMLDRKTGSTEVNFAEVPATDQEIAFLPVSKLSELVKRQKITSRRLTEIYLQRLEKYSPMLRCVVTSTADLALEQAQRADEEIKAGQYRGPLHGIPWGAKDLIAVPGYPTTWGIPQFKGRMIEGIATVARRLEDAGAVLVAKLSLGALANGDKWYGGKTRSPLVSKNWLQWVFRRIGCGHSCRLGWFFIGIGNPGQHRFTSDSLRSVCLASNFRPRQPFWLHAAVLVSG